MFRSIEEFLLYIPAGDLTLEDIGMVYHKRTEAFDRTICKVITEMGAARPGSSFEYVACNKNARRVRREMVEEFCIPGLVLSRAIRESVNRFEKELFDLHRATSKAQNG